MSELNKYQAPSGPPPPTYPQQAHYDNGASNSRAIGSPALPQTEIAPYQQQNGFYGGTPGQYGPPGPYQQPYNQGWGGGPPPGGYYDGPPPGGMYYQQQPPMGYYQQRGGYGPSGAEGVCAGLLGALACCCCLDLLV